MRRAFSWLNVSKEAVRILLPLAILAGGVAGFLLLGSPAAPPMQGGEENRSPVVETVPVKEYRGGLTIETDGVVVPYREIVLSAEVGGRIVEKAAQSRAGAYVSEDQLLVRIDPRSYRLAVERSQQELHQAEANLAEIDVEIENTRSLIELAEEQFKLQQKELTRTERLFEQEVYTEGNVDEAKRAELTTRNSLTTLRNQMQTLKARRSSSERAVELAKARLEEAQLSLERTEVRAPIDGVVYRDEVEEDSYVQPGTPLVVIEDTSAVEVKCSLRMEELYWLWQQEYGDVQPTSLEALPRGYEIPQVPATLTYDIGGRKYRWKGRLHRFEGIGLDEKTRTVPCRILVPNPREVFGDGDLEASQRGPRALLRGMFVKVELHAQPGTVMLRLPERAMRPGSKVWRMDDGRLQILDVPVARLLEDSVLVRAVDTALRAGDPVIVSPLASAVSGMPVREVSSSDALALATAESDFGEVPE